MNLRLTLLPALAFLAAVAFAADHAHEVGRGASAEPSSAIAILSPGSGSNVSGTVKFTRVSDGVRVEVDVKGLTPGAHGFHVHEKGDLSKPDLTSAGGHFNPTGDAHAGPSDAHRHAGDLGNLEVGADGKATTTFVDQKIQLSGPASIIGRAVIIHAKADDLKTQPSGDAGGRVAGGVIGLVN